MQKEFDWKFYLENNSDLKQNGLHLEKDALNHWNKYGKKEGRISNEYDKSNFNWKYYLTNNDDLVNAGFFTEKQARSHWNLYGKKENRFCEPITNNNDSETEINFNDIVDKIYVINLKKHTNRLKNFDNSSKLHNFVYERFDAVNPDDEEYKKEYQEWKKLYNYELNFKNFNHRCYTQRYSDMKNKSRKSAWNHWINFGKNEMRSAYEKTKIVTKGMWGILYSQRNIIKEAIKNNYKNVVIFEDDAMFHKKFNKKLNTVKKIMNENKNWKIIYLGASQEDWTNINVKDGYYKAKNTYGAFSYIINSTFYNELLTEFNKFDDLTDQTLEKLQRKYKNDFYVIFKNIVIVNLNDSSTSLSKNNELYYIKYRWFDDDYLI